MARRFYLRPPPSVGDMVFSVKLNDNARTTWALSRIVNISENGCRLELETPRPGGEFSKIVRSPRECAIVIKENSPPIQSTDYFNLILNG